MPASVATKIRVMIVDDEPLARSNVSILLRRDPEIEIVGECGSGTGAIEAIRTSKPELLFLDIQMPGLDVPPHNSAADENTIPSTPRNRLERVPNVGVWHQRQPQRSPHPHHPLT